MNEPTKPTWRTALDARLQPPYLRLIAIAIIAVGIGLAVMSFITAKERQTSFGPPLGADYAGFYVAGQILERGEPARLYDRQLHDQLYHELLPRVDAKEIIPYVHPPFVAAVFWFQAKYPYEIAVVGWLWISALLYVLGLVLMLGACPGLDSRHRLLVILLALAFEPFLFECWLGGQLSAFGFFSTAAAFFLLQRERPFAAGLALGLCFYKPTLLVLFLPCLLVARQWRLLGGMALTGTLLAVVSLLTVGWDTCVEYINVLLAFRQSTATGSGFEIRTWKYVDLSNNVRLLFGNNSWNLWIVAGLAVGPVLWLLFTWWRWARLTADWQRLLWAVTLALTPVLNLYVGVYDSILIVAAAIIVAEYVIASSGEGALITSGWAYVFVVLAIVPWFSQSLAQVIRLQLYTWVLAYFAWRLARSASKGDS
jgi:hypothetical protein